MIIIRTQAEITATIADPPNHEVGQLLTEQAENLAEYDDYDLSDLAILLIAEQGDAAEAVSDALGWQLLNDEGAFNHPAEIFSEHSRWYELTFILSDDGFGVVLYVPKGECPGIDLLQACERARAECDQAPHG